MSKREGKHNKQSGQSSQQKGSETSPERSTSDLLSEYRNVLYGETTQSEVQNSDLCVIMTNVLDLMAKMEAKLTTVDGRLETIEGHTSSIKKIESKLTKLETNMSVMEHNISGVQKQIVEMQGDIEGTSGLYDQIKSTTDELKEDISMIKKENEKVVSERNEIQALKESNAALKEKILEVQCRSMKYNLIFSGIKEEEGEDCEQVLRDFIRKELRVKSKMDFKNVHRIGPKPKPTQRGQRRDHGAGARDNDRPRSIIAKFIYHSDIVTLKKSARNLKGKDYWINEQFPAEVEEKRKKLYPIAKEARKKKDKVVMVRDKLYINDELVVVDDDERDWPRPESSRSTTRPNKRSRVNSTPERE